ncbi:hypothetical protein J6590_048169 [Homalodisca vitripennis]|nr:hypothetical protein J6590_048169 [Homalodisca vitripennis]
MLTFKNLGLLLVDRPPMEFDSRHVSVVHRLPLRSNQEHPNIVVKFVRREEKSAWIRDAREHRRRLTASVVIRPPMSEGLVI